MNKTILHSYVDTVRISPRDERCFLFFARQGEDGVLRKAMYLPRTDVFHIERIVGFDKGNFGCIDVILCSEEVALAWLMKGIWPEDEQ